MTADKNEKRGESLRLLIEAVVNGEASLEQQNELEQRLLDNEQARDAWLNYVNLHAALNRWYLAGDTVFSPGGGGRRALSSD